MEGSDHFLSLVTRAKQGDKEAFGEIYETHVTPIYRYAFARLHDKQEAEDVTQEAFLKAYGSLPRFEARYDTFLPYLFTITRNLLINRGKRKKPEYLPLEELDRSTGELSASSFAEAKERSALLVQALQVLTETEREIIELRFFGECTYTEIAALCEKKEDAIRQHVARALKKMRTHLTMNPS